MTSPDRAPASPDLTPSYGPEHINKLPEPMQIEAIDKMRGEQGDYVEQAVRDAEAAKGAPLDDTEEQQVRAEAINDFDEQIKKALINGGVAEDNPNFDAYASTLRAASLDKISHTEWNERPVDPDDSSRFLPSKRMVAVEGLQAVADTLPDSDAPANPDVPADPEAPEDPEPETPLLTPEMIEHQDKAYKAQQKVEGWTDDDGNVREGLRSRLAKLSAKRQGRLWTLRRAEYEEVEEIYNDAVKERIMHELAAEKLGGMPEDELRVRAAMKLLAEQKLLRDKAVEQLENTKVSKFVKFMTSGGTVKRMLKGAALGVGVGIVGAATGGLGYGLAGAGAAGLVAGRFSRSYAMFDNKKGRGMRTLDFGENDEMLAARAESGLERAGVEDTENHETALDKVQGYLTDWFEKSTKKEQKKRRKSTYLALGMVAAGTFAASMIHMGLDAASGGGGGNVHGAGPGHTEPSGSGNEGNVGGNHGGTPQEHFPGKQPEHHGGGTHGGHETDGGTPDTDHYSAEALKMSRGEGLYSTFRSLDIPQKDWNELLEKSGPELRDVKVDGTSLTYRMPNGEWGLNMTPDGKFPKEGLDKIMAIHAKMK